MLVSIRSQRDFAHTVEQIEEAWIAAEIRPKRDYIREETNNSFKLNARSPRNGRAD